MKTNLRSMLRGGMSALVLLSVVVACNGEDVTHTTFDNVDHYVIREPLVNLPLKSGTIQEVGKYYNEIGITGGDTILLSAGGCVQTGGHGLTWKRYVDPQGANADRLYHGRITLPGLQDMRIDDFMNYYGGSWLTPGTRGEYLILPHLSYEDDSPSDNGYYSHDNGTGNQCLNVGSAWLSLTIIHQR